APTRKELLRAHVKSPVPSLMETRAGLWVCTGLEQMLQKAMAKEPGDRYQDGAEMLAALEVLPEKAATFQPSPPEGPISGVPHASGSPAAIASPAAAPAGVTQELHEFTELPSPRTLASQHKRREQRRQRMLQIALWTSIAAVVTALLGIVFKW